MRGGVSSLPKVLRVPTLAQCGVRARSVTITPPGSKSLTNRALLLAALARGESTIRGPLLDADDAQRMIEAIRALGARVEPTRGSTPQSHAVRIEGVGGRWKPASDAPTLDLGNAGTATRFLAAGAILSPTPVTIDGNARMRERPIGELAEGLTLLGCRVEFLAKTECPPLRITPPPDLASVPRTIEVSASLSGQFVSALAMAGAFLPHGLTIRLRGVATSAPYIHMTLALMSRVGLRVQAADALHIIRVGPASGECPLPAFEYGVEPDASGATYFWAAAAMHDALACTTPGLDERSLQGDALFPDMLARMGATVDRSRDAWGVGSTRVAGAGTLTPILADMSDMPDAAMTLAAVACFAPGTSILRGLRTLRVKETDRIEAVRAELSRVGVRVETPVQGDHDALTITPPERGLEDPHAPPVALNTYDDHRMAMSLALIALRRPNTSINDPACVAKTYPTFWNDLAMLYRDAR
jgi:3-phosphoshikimate 1-carboxyvinyltransferase